MRAEMIEGANHDQLQRHDTPRKFSLRISTHAFALTINFERKTTMAIKAVFSPTSGPLSVFDDSHHDLMIATSSDRTMLLYSVASNSCRSQPRRRAPESLRARTMAEFIGTKL
jgi:hypothetical protein